MAKAKAKAKTLGDIHRRHDDEVLEAKRAGSLLQILVKRRPRPWTHAMRVDFDYMAPAYEPNEWMHVSRARIPREGSDWCFASGQGSGRRFLVGRVVGWDATHWHLRQYNPRKVRRISRAKWRPYYHVRGKACGASPYYEALAAGNTERAEAIVRANGGLCRMPPPLPTGTPQASIVREQWPGR